MATLRTRIPNWTPAVQGPLYRAVEAVVESYWTANEMWNRQWLRGLLLYADGNDLDTIALNHGVERQSNETDDSLRQRVALAPRLLQLGSLVAYEAHAQNSGLGIVDAKATVQAGRFTPITIYPLKANATPLTPSEIAAFNSYMNEPQRKLMGVTVQHAAPTITPVAITASLLYDSRVVDSGTIIARSLAALREFLSEESKLGNGVYRAGLIDALYVDSVIDVTLAAPANNLPPSDNTIYTFPEGQQTITAKAL